MQTTEKQYIPNDLRRIILIFTSLSMLLVFLLTGFLNLFIQTSNSISDLGKENARTLSLLADELADGQIAAMQNHKDITRSPELLYTYLVRKETFNSLISSKDIYKKIFTIHYNQVNDSLLCGIETSDSKADDAIILYNPDLIVLVSLTQERPAAEIIAAPKISENSVFSDETFHIEASGAKYSLYLGTLGILTFSLNPAKIEMEGSSLNPGNLTFLPDVIIGGKAYALKASTISRAEIDNFFSRPLNHSMSRDYFLSHRQLLNRDSLASGSFRIDGTTVFYSGIRDKVNMQSGLICLEVDYGLVTASQLKKHIIVVLCTLPIFFVFTLITYRLFIYFVTKSYSRLFGKLMDIHNITGSANINNIQNGEKLDLERVIIDLAQQERDKIYIDQLTKLYNRRYFDEVFVKTLEDIPKKEVWGIIFVDLDDFKFVNDNFGHFEGDRVLKAVSNTISSMLSEDDVSVRWGGEEILILIAHCKNAEEVAAKALEIVRNIEDTRIVRNITKPASFDNIQKVTAGSIAYPFYHDHKEYLTIDQHIVLADSCMYYGKRRGKNISVSLKSGKLPDKKDMELLTTGIDYCVEKGYYSFVKPGFFRNK